MNKLTFFFAGLLFLPIIINEVYAVEVGKSFDIIAIDKNTFSYQSHPERIFDGNTWQDWIISEDPTMIKVESARASYIFDKSTCELSFFNGGIINPGDSPVIGSDSYIARQSTDKILWNEVTQISGASCQTTLFNNSTHVIIEGMKENPIIGKMITRYIKTIGSGLKTELEVTNLSPLTDRFFATTQTFEVPRIINFGGVQRDLANFNDSVFDRDFIRNNKAEITQLTNKINFDLGLGFKHLTDITILWDGSIAKMQMDYSFNTKILLPGQTFIVDPTFSSGTSDFGRNIGTNAAGSACSPYDGSDAFPGLNILDADIVNNSCHIGWFEFDITSIPSFMTVLSAEVEFDVDVDNTNDKNAVIRNLVTDPDDNAVTYLESRTGQAISSEFSCCNVGNDQTQSLNGSGVALIQNRVTAGDGFYAYSLSWVDWVRESGTTYGSKGFSDAELTIVYTNNSPDAVLDLVAGNTTFTSTDLDWSEPDHNGTLLGYQINFTNPFGNPLTIITNNTGTSDTASAISGLAQNTNYTFRVSIWTNFTNNATGNLANITTLSLGNFTVGFIDINATNLDFRTWVFARTDLNSSAYELSVIYPNTYNATCRFHFKFANTDQNYSNLATTIPGSGQLEATFTFNNTANEVIDVLCNDENGAEPDGIFLLTQDNFLLLQQFEDFRTGTYGTLGMFGSIDMITLVGVIIAMIGFNRINESVGAFFMLVILGVMAFFQIIIWPTALTGAIAVITMLAITTTRKK